MGQKKIELHKVFNPYFQGKESERSVGKDINVPKEMQEDPRSLNKPTFANKHEDKPLADNKGHQGVVPIENLTKKAPVANF